MANLDIYNFTTLSSIQDGDYLLLAQSSGANGKVTYSLTKNKIKNEIEPTIVNGVWYIGGVSTNIIATGQTPTLRNAGGQIEWKYTNEPDTAYRPLVLISDLKGADGDNIELLATTDYIQWKPTSGTTWMNLIAITDLKGANGAAVGLRVSNGYIQYNVDGITEWTNIISVSELKGDTGYTPTLEIGTVTSGTSSQATITSNGTNSDGSPKYKIDLTIQKGDIGDTGKTPQIEIGTVTQGTTSSATLVSNGVDSNSNPKYKLNLVLVKGDTGDTGKVPQISIGTVSSGTSSSATLTTNGVDSDNNPKYNLNLTLEQGKSGVSVSTTEPTDNSDFWINPTDSTNPPQTFIDLWNTACTVGNRVDGSYNSATGYFELNGLTDITYSQAREIYNCTNNLFSTRYLTQVCHYNFILRTNLPAHNYLSYSYQPISFSGGFNMCTNLEIVNFKSNITSSPIVIQTAMGLFSDCYVLKKILGIISLYATAQNNMKEMFVRCYLLESVELCNLKFNISFSDSPNLDKNSIIYMLTKRGNTVGTPITITLHATAYAKYSVDSDITALLTETSTQGEAILAQA